MYIFLKLHKPSSVDRARPSSASHLVQLYYSLNYIFTLHLHASLALLSDCMLKRHDINGDKVWATMSKNAQKDILCYFLIIVSVHFVALLIMFLICGDVYPSDAQNLITKFILIVCKNAYGMFKGVINEYVNIRFSMAYKCVFNIKCSYVMYVQMLPC